MYRQSSRDGRRRQWREAAKRHRDRRKREAADVRLRIDRQRRLAGETALAALYSLTRCPEFRARWERAVGVPWDESVENDPWRLAARIEAMVELGEVVIEP